MTPEELMADMEKVMSLAPGKKKINIHASYAIFEDGQWVDRDQLEPKHFKKWVDFAKAKGVGIDFNPTFFSSPKVKDGLGIAILSTPKGILSGRNAEKQNVGGEILCYVW